MHSWYSYETSLKKSLIRKTYKTANEFFNQISSTPKIHIILEHSSDILYVVFCSDTCEHKGAVHEQHRKKHHLKYELVLSKKTPKKPTRHNTQHWFIHTVHLDFTRQNFSCISKHYLLWFFIDRRKQNMILIFSDCLYFTYVIKYVFC